MPGARRARLPAPVVALAGLGVLFTVLPFIGLVTQVAWGTLLADLTAADTLEALRLSIVTSIAATGLVLLLGVPLAWLQARFDFPGRAVVRGLTTLPLVLPPVVAGVALLAVFGRQAPLGGWLFDTFGARIAFSTFGVVIAEAFVSMPILVLAVEAGIRGVDPRFEAAARSLGAGPWRVLTRVTLPVAAPSIVAGAVLSWARALGEFGATVTFAGNFPGRTQTLPLAVYVALESHPEGAVTMSLLLVAISVVVLVGLRRRWLVM